MYKRRYALGIQVSLFWLLACLCWVAVALPALQLYHTPVLQLKAALVHSYGHLSTPCAVSSHCISYLCLVCTPRQLLGVCMTCTACCTALYCFVLQVVLLVLLPSFAHHTQLHACMAFVLHLVLPLVPPCTATSGAPPDVI